MGPDEQFALKLDECSQRMRRGETLEQCLAGCPVEYREELARLLPLTANLVQLAHNPSPDFQARLERKLLVSVNEARWGQRPGLLPSLGRFFSGSPAVRLASLGLAALVILLGGGFGAVQASEDSLPDSPLYQVKTAREWVELVLTASGESQTVAYVRVIDERGRELERAAGANKPERTLLAVATRLARSTEEMVDKALEARARGNPRPAARALASVRSMQQRLNRLDTRGSPEFRRVVQRAVAFLEGQEQRLLKQARIRAAQGPVRE